MNPDPKLAGKPFRANALEWNVIRAQFLAERCWVCDRPWHELHHILPRDGAGTWPNGDDVTVNLAPVCTHCHRLVEERDTDARARLRGALMPSNVAYLSGKLGGDDRALVFLERHYATAVAA